MSAHIRCNDKIILHVRNATFNFFYDNLLFVVEESNLLLSKNLHKLMEKLELGIYGVGCDIADFVKNERDAKDFIRLVKQALDRYTKEYPTLSVEIKDAMQNFYQELLKYAEELKD